jgi:hypothetical protein
VNPKSSKPSLLLLKKTPQYFPELQFNRTKTGRIALAKASLMLAEITSSHSMISALIASSSFQKAGWKTPQVMPKQIQKNLNSCSTEAHYMIILETCSWIHVARINYSGYTDTAKKKSGFTMPLLALFVAFGHHSSRLGWTAWG